MPHVGLRALAHWTEFSDDPNEDKDDSRAQADISDWLRLNGLSRRGLLSLLDENRLSTEGRVAAPDVTVAISAERAWATAATALRHYLPALGGTIDMVRDMSPKCLEASPESFPQPFTCDQGPDKLPFVSVQFACRAVDILAVAHEFGHALQIVVSHRSDRDRMPSMARELCAFIAELALLDHLSDRRSLLHIPVRNAWARQNLTYLDKDCTVLRRALNAPTARYDYRWNYPPARLLAKNVHQGWSTQQKVALFRSGETASDVLAPLLDDMVEPSPEFA